MAKFYDQVEFSTAKSIADELIKSTDLDRARQLAARLINDQPTLSVGMGTGSIFFRARECPSQYGYEHVKDILMPPPSITKIGRANHERKPMLYAASSVDAALSEIQPEEGKMYHIAGFIVAESKEARLSIIGEHFHSARTGYLRFFGIDPEHSVVKNLNEQGFHRSKKILFIDSLLGDILSEPNARCKNYVGSRAIVDVIFHQLNRAGGIIYPSVRHKFSTNICVKPDHFIDNFKIVTSCVVRVDEIWPNGFLEIKSLNNLDLDMDTGRFSVRSSGLGSYFFNVTPDEHGKAVGPFVNHTTRQEDDERE